MSTNCRQNEVIRKCKVLIANHVIACMLLITGFFIFFIRLYQRVVSPLFGPKCRFTPTCSHYAIIALKRFGFIKGCWLTAKRVLKCHPLHKGGEDPVPLKTKNNREK